MFRITCSELHVPTTLTFPFSENRALEIYHSSTPGTPGQINVNALHGEYYVYRYGMMLAGIMSTGNCGSVDVGRCMYVCMYKALRSGRKKAHQIMRSEQRSTIEFRFFQGS